MGKRKLNNASFWQCEWTGFPMKSAHCYWPSWSSTGKLIKKGSYCNWESVVAHAHYELQQDNIDAVEHNKVLDYVQTITGTVVEPAPHYNELAHTKGRMTALDFHNACTFQTHPITAVKIAPSGEVFEVILHPNSVNNNMKVGDYLHKPFNNDHGPPSTFHSMRKKGNKGTDRDLAVYYYPAKDLPHNTTASNLFKMQLYGDVLMVQQSREQSFMPRERFVSFDKMQFDEQFCKKRKRAEVQCMTGAQYEDVKEKMQAVLNAYEQSAAASAEAPKSIAHRALNPHTTGKILAQAARERLPKPDALLTPPSVVVGA